MTGKWTTVLRKLYRQYPFLGSFAAIVVLFSLSRLIGLLPEMLPEGYGRDFADVFSGFMPILLIVFLLGYQWCYHHGRGGKTFLAVLPQFLLSCAVTAAVMVISLSEPEAELLPPAGIALGLLELFRIGFFEESFFRGIITNGLGIRYGRDAKGVWLSVVLSGFLFGAVHMINLSAGVTLISALMQSLVAMFCGFFFAAAYLRGGNIWVMIFLHALVDSGGLFAAAFLADDTTAADAINGLNPDTWYVLPIFYTVLTVILLRKSKIPEALENLSSAAEKDEEALSGF